MDEILYESLLQLVCLGIGHSEPEFVDFEENKCPDVIETSELGALKALADDQGLSTVVLDGLDELRVKSGEL